MPAFDATASANTGAINAASLTFAHTCTGSGRVLIVGVSSTAAPTSVTYAGVPMVKLSADVTNTAVSSVWFLAAPTAGANNVIITMASSVAILGGSISITGATQETSHITVLPVTAAAAASVTGTISPTKPGCILIDNAAYNVNSPPTAGGSQTQEVSQSASAGLGQGMSYQILTGSTPTALSWSWVSTGSVAYRIIAVPAPTQTLPTNNLRPHPFSPGLAR